MSERKEPRSAGCETEQFKHEKESPCLEIRSARDYCMTFTIFRRFSGFIMAARR